MNDKKETLQDKINNKEYKFQPSKGRMRQIIQCANDPAKMLMKKGMENLFYKYQIDVNDLITYIRELEGKLNIKSVTLYDDVFDH